MSTPASRNLTVAVSVLEVRETVLEIDAYDAQGRKIDLVVDRRSGEVVSRKFDD